MHSIRVMAGLVAAGGLSGSALASFQVFFGASQFDGTAITAPPFPASRVPYATAKSDFEAVLRTTIATENFEARATTGPIGVNSTIPTNLGTLKVTQAGGTSPFTSLPRVRDPGFADPSFLRSTFGSRVFQADFGADFRIDLDRPAGAIGFSMRDFDTVTNAVIVLSLEGQVVHSFTLDPQGALPVNNVAFFGVAARNGLLFDAVTIEQLAIGDAIDFDNFITGTVIPLPTSVLLAGAGLLVVGMRRRGAAR